MIRIKDYIFNENEIVYIEEFDAQSLGIMFKGKDKAIFVDAHPEDIEWNYENFNDCKKLEEVILAKDVRIKELETRNKNQEKLLKELEEENERISKELNTCMIERNNFLSRIDKAIKYIEDRTCVEDEGTFIYGLDNIDCEELYKILKGEENGK